MKMDSDLFVFMGGKHGDHSPLSWDHMVCFIGKTVTFHAHQTMYLLDDTWEMLGTNLSIKLPNGDWTTDTSRLILMDRRDFNQLGIGIDDLIDAYIQTVLAVIAIDKMADRLMASGQFDYQLFQSLNPDDALLREIQQANIDSFQ